MSVRVTRVIIGAATVAAVALLAWRGSGDTICTREGAARSRLAVFASLIETMVAEDGRFPKSVEDVQAWLAKAGDGKPSDQHRDAFGNAMILNVTWRGGEDWTRYLLVSMGPDAIAGTEDDLVHEFVVRVRR